MSKKCEAPSRRSILMERQKELPMINNISTSMSLTSYLNIKGLTCAVFVQNLHPNMFSEPINHLF